MIWFWFWDILISFGVLVWHRVDSLAAHSGKLGSRELSKWFLHTSNSSDKVRNGSDVFRHGFGNVDMIPKISKSKFPNYRLYNKYWNFIHGWQGIHIHPSECLSSNFLFRSARVVPWDATATWGTGKRLFPYFWRLWNSAYSYLGLNFSRFCESSITSLSLTTEKRLW